MLAQTEQFFDPSPYLKETERVNRDGDRHSDFAQQRHAREVSARRTESSNGRFALARNRQASLPFPASGLWCRFLENTVISRIPLHPRPSAQPEYFKKPSAISCIFNEHGERVGRAGFLPRGCATASAISPLISPEISPPSTPSVAAISAGSRAMR